MGLGLPAGQRPRVLDGGLVVEQHHRVGVAACGSAREQLFGRLQGMAVAFQTRGRPGQVHAQLFEHLARVASGRKLFSQPPREIEFLGQGSQHQPALIRHVAVDKLAPMRRYLQGTQCLEGPITYRSCSEAALHRPPAHT